VSLPDDQKYANLISALNEVLSRQNTLEARLIKLERAVFGTALPAEPVDAPVAAEPVIPASVMEAATVEGPALETKAALQAEPVKPPAIETPVVAAPVLEPPTSESPALETKVGLTILNRIGVVTLVLGVAFFFKWAVDNNWVGPTGRVMLGLVTGLAALGIADVLWRKGQQIFAQGITGAAVAIIYLSFYAAFDFYQLIPQAVAFLLLLATTIGAAALALRYNAIAISALGLFGAYLIPLLLSNGEDHPWFLVLYLLMLNFAARALSARHKWPWLEVLSFLATVMIFGGWLMDNGGKPADHLVATLGVFALYGQRFLTSWPVLFLFTQLLAALSVGIIWEQSESVPWLSLLVSAGGLAFAHLRPYPPLVATAACACWVALGIWFSSGSTTHFMLSASVGFLLFYGWTWWRSAHLDEPPKPLSMFVFALNGTAYYALVYADLHRDHHQWLGLLAVGVAASYLAFGAFLQRKIMDENVSEMVPLALGLAAAFLTLAIPIQLSGFTVTMAWSVQAAALTWMGVRLNSARTITWALVIFALAFLHVLVVDSRMYPDFNSYALLFNARFFTFASLAVALLLSAHWASKLDRQFALVHFVAGHIVMLGGLSLEVIGWANRSARPENLLSVETIGITILFAVYAVVLVSVGVAARSPVSRLAGLVLTAIVILKLYFFDVWQLGRFYQIIAFVILGVLLLSTSFLYSRFKSLISQWRKD
jgi:uncharacterized membrane protein